MEYASGISVIVPCYNCIDCLEKCVNSIVRQTYCNLEIILVDDGSTDGTAELCDEIGKTDSRIRIFHKKNGGSSSARNWGLRYATGEYVGFVDSDDYIDGFMYENLLTALKNEPESYIAQIGRQEIDVAGTRMPDICTPPELIEKVYPVDFIKELLLHRGDCSFCTKLFHKSLFENCQFPEGSLNEDFRLLVEMLGKLSKDNTPILSLPQYGYYVYYRIGSNTRKKDRQEFSRVYRDIVENADWVQDFVEKEFMDDKELSTIAVRFNLYQRLEYMLHIPIKQMTNRNFFYRDVVSYLRAHSLDTILSPYLTKKNKLYLILLTWTPRVVRRGHYFIKLFSKEEYVSQDM